MGTSPGVPLSQRLCAPDVMDSVLQKMVFPTKATHGLIDCPGLGNLFIASPDIDGTHLA